MMDDARRIGSGFSLPLFSRLPSLLFLATFLCVFLAVLARGAPGRIIGSRSDDDTRYESPLGRVSALLSRDDGGGSGGRGVGSRLPDIINRAPTQDLDNAATLKKGIRQTVGGGSVKDPDILDLASVQELAAMESDLSILGRVMTKLGFTFYLEQTRDLTFLMPTNMAFSNAEVQFDKLPWMSQWQILQNHVIPQYVIKLDELEEDKTYSSWHGSPLVLSVTPGRGGRRAKAFHVNKKGTILGDPPGIETFNGISYKIDTLLVPDDLLESMVIEDHQSEGVVMGDDAATTEQGRTENMERGDEQEMVGDRTAFVGRLEPTSKVITGQDAPEFVQAINAAHSQWNVTPEERKKKRSQRLNSSTGYVSPEDQLDQHLEEGERGKRNTGVLQNEPWEENNDRDESQEEEYQSNLLPEGSASDMDEEVGGEPEEERLSSGRIQALGMPEEVFYSEWNEGDDLQSGVDKPHLTLVQLTGDVVPDEYGWAGVHPGWNQHKPGQVLPRPGSTGASVHPDAREGGTSGIAVYSEESEDSASSSYSSEEEEGALFSRSRRERNRERRYRARMARMGIPTPEERPGRASISNRHDLDNAGLSGNDPHINDMTSNYAPHFDNNLLPEELEHVKSVDPSKPLLLPAKPPLFRGSTTGNIESRRYDILPVPTEAMGVSEQNLSPVPTEAMGVAEQNVYEALDAVGFHPHVNPEESFGQVPGLLPGEDYSIQTLGLEDPVVRALQYDTSYVIQPTVVDTPLFIDVEKSFLPSNSVDEDLHTTSGTGNGAYYVTSDDYYMGGSQKLTSSNFPSTPSSTSDMFFPVSSVGATEMVSYEDLDVMSIIAKLPELSTLYELMSAERFQNLSSSGRMARKIKMTLFAPINEAIHFPNMVSERDGFVDELRIEAIGKQIAGNHVSIGRVVDPDKLVEDEVMTVPAKGHRTKIRVKKQLNQRIIVNDTARVVRIIRASNGFIYEVDQILMPKYNDGPTLEQLIQSDLDLSMTKSIMGGNGVFGQYSGIGPITVFLVANSGFAGPDGGPLPQCIHNSLKRPENQIYARKLVAHMVLQDIVETQEMNNGSSLMPVYGPPLKVARSYYQYDGTLYKPDIYIEGQKIIRANIPIYNGIAHILSGPINLPGVDLGTISYWTCLDEYLRQNTRQVRAVFDRVDDFRSLPVLGVPPDARPAWVGYGLPRYFPPHTTYRTHNRNKRVGRFRTPGWGLGGGGGGEDDYYYTPY